MLLRDLEFIFEGFGPIQLPKVLSVFILDLDVALDWRHRRFPLDLLNRTKPYNRVVLVVTVSAPIILDLLL